jgi:hypothetical protein
MVRGVSLCHVHALFSNFIPTVQDYTLCAATPKLWTRICFVCYMPPEVSVAFSSPVSSVTGEICWPIIWGNQLPHFITFYGLHFSPESISDLLVWQHLKKICCVKEACMSQHAQVPSSLPAGYRCIHFCPRISWNYHVYTVVSLCIKICSFIFEFLKLWYNEIVLLCCNCISSIYTSFCMHILLF